jgi:hypothetical protein
MMREMHGNAGQRTIVPNIGGNCSLTRAFGRQLTKFGQTQDVTAEMTGKRTFRATQAVRIYFEDEGNEIEVRGGLSGRMQI